jgi:hypothetical protein
MKKTMDLLIYPAFVIASVLVANILSPPVMEVSHVPLDQIDAANRSKSIGYKLSKSGDCQIRSWASFVV